MLLHKYCNNAKRVPSWYSYRLEIVVIVLGALLCGLNCFFRLFQEKVLHNVMSIFTFMGASVIRQDDSYSFEVITKTLDTVIPALIQVCTACSVLHVLIHGMIDAEQTQQGSRLTF